MCYLLSDGLSLLQKWAALPSHLVWKQLSSLALASQRSCACGMWRLPPCEHWEFVAQGIFFEEKVKSSLWHPGLHKPACFEYDGVGHLSMIRKRDLADASK